MNHLKHFCGLLIFFLSISISHVKAKVIVSNSRVMSYNIRYDNPQDGLLSWSHRKDGVLSLLHFHQPDILCVQEALDHQVKDLNKGLSKFEYVGVGRDDGKEKGEYAAIFYNKEKYKKIDQGHFWLSSTPEKASLGWDAACIRICSWVKLRDKISRKVLFVFNTHFDHVGTKAQQESAKLILKKVQALTEDQKYPFVLTGDFNLNPNHKPIQLLSKKMDDSKLVSRTKPYGPDGTFTGFDFNHKLDSRIDYIFVREEMIVKRYAVLSDSKNQNYYSDHLPVMVDIKY